MIFSFNVLQGKRIYVSFTPDFLKRLCLRIDKKYAVELRYLSTFKAKEKLVLILCLKEIENSVRVGNCKRHKKKK